MAVSEKFVPPIFVTADMNFPSVDVANLNATAIYNDLLSLKKEVKQLHDEKDLEKVVLQDIQSALQEVREERSNKKDVLDNIFDSIMDIKSQLPNYNNLLVKANDSNTDEVSAADIGLLEITSSAMNVASTSQSRAKSYAAATAGTLSFKLSKVSNAKNCDTGKKHKESKLNPSLTVFSTREIGNSVSESSETWEVKSKRKRTPKLGKKEVICLKVIKPLSKPADIFISRLDPETTEDQLTAFVESQFGNANSMVCKKLKTKFDSYSSFHVLFQRVIFSEALLLDNWPAGALVKRFYASATRIDNKKDVDKLATWSNSPQEKSIDKV